MLQLNPVYLFWNRSKTLTGSPDPTRANGTNKPCGGGGGANQHFTFTPCILSVCVVDYSSLQFVSWVLNRMDQGDVNRVMSVTIETN